MEFIFTQELQELTKAKEAVDLELAEVKTRLAAVVGLLQPVLAPQLLKASELAITDLQTVHLTVKDAAASAKFFAHVFTLPKPEVRVSESKTSCVVDMKTMRLELHQANEDSNESQRPGGHAIKFSTRTASIEAVKTALATRDTAWSYMIPENFHALRFVDLDGYEWEVVDTRDNPLGAFRALARKHSTDYLGTKEDFSAPHVQKETEQEQSQGHNSKGKQVKGHGKNA